MKPVRKSPMDFSMNLTPQEPGGPGQAAALTAGVRAVDRLDGLATINDPATELAVWQRSLPSCFRDWVDRLDAVTLPHIRILVQPGDLRCALVPLLDACGLVPCDMRDLLVDDIDDLVTAFSDITRSAWVDVRLERVEHDACWKFHRDTVEARLVTTYRGPTTEWVQMAHAEKAIAEQRGFDGPLERLGDHDVALFKGNCAGPNRGIVHRSPPIAGTGLARLFLCLNKRTIVSPEPWTKA